MTEPRPWPSRRRWNADERVGSSAPVLGGDVGALTVVSGFVDAVSFLGLGHVFTANMTGNVILLGFAAAGAPGFCMGASLCTFAAFVVGAVVGGRLARRVQPLRNLLLVAMVIEVACTALAAVIAGAVPPSAPGGPATPSSPSSP